MLCSNCGEENNKGKFCCECGHSLLDNKIYNSDIEEAEKEYIQSEIQIEKINSQLEEVPIEAEVNIEEIFVEPIMKEEERVNTIPIKEVEDYIDLSKESEEILVEFKEDVEKISEELSELEENINMHYQEESFDFNIKKEVDIDVDKLESNSKSIQLSDNKSIQLSEITEVKKETIEEFSKGKKKGNESNLALIVYEKALPEKVENKVEEKVVEKIEEKSENIISKIGETLDNVEEIIEELPPEIKEDYNKSVEEDDEEDEESTNYIEEMKKDSKKIKNEKSNKKNSKEINNKSKNKSSKKPKINKKFVIIGGIAIAAVIIGGLAINPIKADYYLKKMDAATLQVEKVQYASKALEVLNSSKTIKALESALEGTIETDIKVVDNKLDEVKSILSEEDYKALAEKIKNLEVNYYCDNNDYKDAISQLGIINDLGANFKKNINYSDMILYSINNLIDSSIKKVDSVMKGEESTIVKENIDNDNFDELINIGKDSSTGEIKIDLFKYVDGAYKSVNSFNIAKSSYNLLNNTEIYYYNTNESAIYLSYKDSNNNVIISIINAEDSKIKVKNTVKCGKYAFIQDIDNDGRYEVGSSKVSSDKAEVWYKLNEDGTTSILDLNKKESETADNTNTESSTSTSSDVNTSKESNDSETKKDSSYIIADSNSRYLTENDLAGFSKSKLSLVRNEIFARYGYVFTSSEYVDYFNNKSWYKADSSYTGGNETLNDYEKANIELIKRLEES